MLLTYYGAKIKPLICLYYLYIGFSLNIWVIMLRSAVNLSHFFEERQFLISILKWGLLLNSLKLVYYLSVQAHKPCISRSDSAVCLSDGTNPKPQAFKLLLLSLSLLSSSTLYSRTSMARTLMAPLPWLFRTLS